LVVVYYSIDYVKDVKGSNYVRNRVIKVAQKLKDEGLAVKFAVSNAEEFSNELKEYGVESVEANEKYVSGRNAKNQKFKFEGEYS
jgi:protein disulfide isomerase family A protein 3